MHGHGQVIGVPMSPPGGAGSTMNSPIVAIEMIENGYILRYAKLEERKQAVDPMSHAMQGIGALAAEAVDLTEGEGEDWDPAKKEKRDRLVKAAKQLGDGPPAQSIYVWVSTTTYCAASGDVGALLDGVRKDEKRARSLMREGFLVANASGLSSAYPCS